MRCSRISWQLEICQPARFAHCVHVFDVYGDSLAAPFLSSSPAFHRIGSTLAGGTRGQDPLTHGLVAWILEMTSFCECHARGHPDRESSTFLASNTHFRPFGIGRGFTPTRGTAEADCSSCSPFLRVGGKAPFLFRDFPTPFAQNSRCRILPRWYFRSAFVFFDRSGVGWVSRPVGPIRGILPFEFAGKVNLSLNTGSSRSSACSFPRSIRLTFHEHRLRAGTPNSPVHPSVERRSSSLSNPFQPPFGSGFASVRVLWAQRQSTKATCMPRKSKLAGHHGSMWLLFLALMSCTSFLWTTWCFWNRHVKVQRRVELGVRGHFVSIADAVAVGNAAPPRLERFSSPLAARKRQEEEMHVLVGVLSGCCDARSRAKRTMARRTWALRALQDARKRAKTRLTVRFVLGQTDPRLAGRVLSALESELDQLQAWSRPGDGGLLSEAWPDARGYAFGDSHDFASAADMLFTAGMDTYNDLPRKTKGLMAYASSFDGITHLLKTDDDCYVRLPQLLQSTVVARAVSFRKQLEKEQETKDELEAERNEGETEGTHGERGRVEPMDAKAKAERAMDAAYEGVYAGFVENPRGFWPVRDPDSKWYMDPAEMPDNVPHVHYAAGWGYMLSRDAFETFAKDSQHYDESPKLAPTWWKAMHWEDVMVALVLYRRGIRVQNTLSFRPAWGACGNTTAVKHADVDAPDIFPGFYAQQVSGLWDKKVIQCNFGTFRPGSYMSWKEWRDGLEGVQRVR